MAGPRILELLATATVKRGAGGRNDVDVRLTAMLSDGRELALLDYRGFASVPHPPRVAHPALDDQDLFTVAWSVGPDEKFDDHTDRDMAESHFTALAATIEEAGVPTTPETLMSVPFRVRCGARERVWPTGLDWF